MPRSTSAASRGGADDGPDRARWGRGRIVEIVGLDVDRGLRLEWRHAGRVAQERHVSDATAREIEDHRLGRRIVARAADQLDHLSRGGRRQRNTGRRPARSDRTVGDPADRGPDDDDHRLRVRGLTSHRRVCRHSAARVRTHRIRRRIRRRLSLRVGNETGSRKVRCKLNVSTIGCPQGMHPYQVE